MIIVYPIDNEAQINNSFKVDAQRDTKKPEVNMLQDTQILA